MPLPEVWLACLSYFAGAGIPFEARQCPEESAVGVFVDLCVQLGHVSPLLPVPYDPIPPTPTVLLLRCDMGGHSAMTDVTWQTTSDNVSLHWPTSKGVRDAWGV